MLTVNEASHRSKSRSRKRSSARYSLGAHLNTALADPERVVFLDVETTGLSWFYDELTVIGWISGGNYEVIIAGQDPGYLLTTLETAQTIVTFNGTLFDLKFLKKKFGDIRLPPTHIDLRYLARRVGLTGGQKAIEANLGLFVRNGVEQLDGRAAVLLWHQYVRGNKEALTRLIDYNRRDVVGMCGILDEVIRRLSYQPDLLLPQPLFSPHAERSLLERLRVPDTTSSISSRSPTFQSLFSGTPAEYATIVGIDLTGSEARPSGWCTLKGSKAETCKVFTDDELLTKGIAARPTLVSIDSPLSIPFGRTRVEDDDPMRNEFGIMRECERELKRRGINVYPCLIPSMQRLTERGIRLAERFRTAGIPVIESYPGAAQDIIGIPRKAAGTEYLRLGLAGFGLEGFFVEHEVSHDELDAITSALVGSFFVADQYEALRGPREGALIIPSRNKNGNCQMVVGISGRICAGKTTTARMLEKYGFAYTRFSLVIDEQIIARNEVPNRALRQSVGMELNRTKGQRWLCEKVVERVGLKQLIVVDGLRFPEDHTFFAEQYGSNFVHAHVTARKEIRQSRYREHEFDGVDFEIAEVQEVESSVDSLRALVTLVIENNVSKEELENGVLAHLRSALTNQDRECLYQLL